MTPTPSSSRTGRGGSDRQGPAEWCATDAVEVRLGKTRSRRQQRPPRDGTRRVDERHPRRSDPVAAGSSIRERREVELLVRCARRRPVGGRFALSFEEAPFGWVGGQLDGTVVGGDGCVTPPCTGEEVCARGVVGLVVLEQGRVERVEGVET